MESQRGYTGWEVKRGFLGLTEEGKSEQSPGGRGEAEDGVHTASSRDCDALFKLRI